MSTVSMDEEFVERRRKLAEFLMSGKAVDSHFSLDSFISGPCTEADTYAESARERFEILKKEIEEGVVGSDVDKPLCDTTACIAGMCPIVFPNSWEWNQEGDPVFIGFVDPIASFSNFFGIVYCLAERLCIQSSKKGPFPLDQRVTAKEAGEAILALNGEELPDWAF